MNSLSYNHHLMAKEITDFAIGSWRSGTWSNAVVSRRVRTVASRSSFPSPDATFFDEENKRLIGFEFKPPTETKRGILTAVGQVFGYSDHCHLSYIICPKVVEEFAISEYVNDLFLRSFRSRFPLGLIEYQNERLESPFIRCDVDVSTILLKEIEAEETRDRFWAKHQDMPFHALYLLLESAYILPDFKTDRLGEVWTHFWNIHYLNNRKVVLTLDDTEPNIFWHKDDKPIRPAQKKKAELRKLVEKGQLSTRDALTALQQWADPRKKGDCYSSSYKKNFVTLLKHLRLIDDNARLTPSGFELLKLGKVYGHNSSLFLDAIKREFLFSGKHLDLILDLDSFCKDRNYFFRSKDQLWEDFTSYYDNLGKVKWNDSRRKKENQNEQFRYEEIIWGKLDFLNGQSAISTAGGFKGLYFNWPEITRICSL